MTYVAIVFLLISVILVLLAVRSLVRFLGRSRQCCGSALVLMRIQIQHFRSMRNRIQDVDDKMFKFYIEIFFFFLSKIYNLDIPKSVKDVQATGEAFSQ
jgi:hypothetical protein